MTKRNVAMAKENLSVTLPSKLRSLVEKEAKRGKRSRSAIVSDALQLYFRLRRIGSEDPTDEERAIIAEGKLAYEQGEVVPSGGMPWDLVITRPAERDLRQFSSDDLRRVDAAFEATRSNPYNGDIKFLTHSGGAIRRRVGVWRIFFTVVQQQRRVVIIGVKRRTSTTY
jgi:mRNA-degrading endonuclease RelE of RelBE toxin-antitoxin system